MAFDLWLSLVLVCILGALSPGPSLALVVRNTINAGRTGGLSTAVAHGLGVALYAAIAVTGIGLVIVQSETVFNIIQYSGALFLLYLAYKSLTSHRGNIIAKHDAEEPVVTSKVNGWRDGFFIAFLNPKLALFFLALFSQFVDSHATLLQQSIMVATVGVIDTLWYCLVAWGLSRGAMLQRLRDNAHYLERITGLVLILLAVRVIW
ncbi:LysE family translocator [Thalassotalea maritima]|uniref:LysE family translocator n=1 Tax=Thalassotalea maritima TaxID=3242416 RepID=UPI0035292F28